MTAAMLVLLVTADCEFSTCSRARQQYASDMTRGNPDRGKNVIPYYGCPTCHTIPGIRGTYGQVGPSLAGLSGRMYIAGILPNSPDNLLHWIRKPREVNPKTDMPDMSIPESDARDITAYLLSLR